MTLSRRSIGLGMTVVLLTSAFLAYRWQPDQQLVRRWEGFLEAFSTRRWSAVDPFLSPDYDDSWGHSRQELKHRANYALREYTHLDVRVESISIRRTGHTATIEGVVRITGSGGYPAESTRRAVNGVYSATEFKWERQPWRPWDWRLVRMENPEIDLPRAYGAPVAP